MSDKTKDYSNLFKKITTDNSYKVDFEPHPTLYVSVDPSKPSSLTLYNRITKDIFRLVCDRFSNINNTDYKIMDYEKTSLSTHEEVEIYIYNQNNKIGSNIDDEWVIICPNCRAVQPVKEWTGSLPDGIHRCEIYNDWRNRSFMR